MELFSQNQSVRLNIIGNPKCLPLKENQKLKENDENQEKLVLMEDSGNLFMILVIILGNSMVKHINGWEVSKRLQSDCRVYVKWLSDARAKYMKDYMKPSLRENLDHFILHVDTNDLSTERSPKLIAKSIVNLSIATALKGKSCYVIVSNIIVCTNNIKLGNRGKLHFNQKESKVLGDTFLKKVPKVFN